MNGVAFTLAPVAAAPSAEAVVRAVGLTKLYGETPVVKGIDFSVYRGECVGLLGPNGAGKTTTLRLLLGTAHPSGGTLEVLGLPVPARAAEMRRRLGVVPQFDNLDPDFTVAENLQTYGSYFGLGRAALAERVPVLLEFAALTERAGAKISALSGGMKRRLTLARALINDPELLILDEPTTGLDPQARQLLWRRLRELLAAGKTLLLTTHYMEEAERLCDRIMVMDHGVILATGSPAELIRAHIEPQVVELFGPRAAEWLAAEGAGRAERTEEVGESVLCYLHDERPLLDALAAVEGLRFTHRRANLEDVFLKLTGRDLRTAS